MIKAENLLIFRDFYDSLWLKLSQIALAVHLVKIGSEPDQNMTNEVVCTDEQRSLYVNKDDQLDVWNEKIDNLNSISMMRQSEI